MSFNQKGQTKKLLKFLKRIENPCCDCPDISKDDGNVIECRSDGLYAPEGGAGYTDEQAQDAVGGILNPDEFTYDDVTPLISINEIDWSKIINAPTFIADAENGVSLDDTAVVLGQDVGAVGDPGQLLSNREIPMNGFSFAMGRAGTDLRFLIDPVNGVYGMGDFDQVSSGMVLIMDDSGGDARVLITSLAGDMLELDQGIDLYRMGDINNTNNGSRLEINDSNREIRLRTGTQVYLFGSQQTYGFGELLGAFNGSQIGIDDLNESFDYQTNFGHLFNVNSGSGSASLGDLDFNLTGFQMFLDYANQHFSILTGPFPGSRFFDIDRVASMYQMGDLDAAGNNTMFFIDDANTVISASINGYTDPGMYIQINAGLYLFGDSGGNHNGNALFIDDSAGVMRMQTNAFYWFATNDTTDVLSLAAPGNSQLSLNGVTGQIQMGDLGATGLGISFIVDDITGEFRFDNTASDTIFTINGTPGFSGTVANPTTITVIGGIVTNVA